MAGLDEGSVGIRVLAGLPENNGLPAIASELLDNPRSVYALVELRPKTEVTNLDTDSHTMVLRIVQMEPLSGAAADELRDQLRAVREKRSGVVPLPGVDGVDVPAVEVKIETDLPSGPEWGDAESGEPPAEAGGEPVADAEPTPDEPALDGAVAAPPFAPPTPITKGSSKQQRAQG